MVEHDPRIPYDPAREPKKWNVAKMLLSGDTVSVDELRLAAGGRLSPRTMGFILRDLEAQELSFLRVRDPELGTLYRYDPAVPYSEIHRISKAGGPDARRNPPRTPQDAVEEPPVSEVQPPPNTPEGPPEPLLEPLIADSALSDDGVQFLSFDDDGVGLIDLEELGFLNDDGSGPGA